MRSRGVRGYLPQEVTFMLLLEDFTYQESPEMGQGKDPRVGLRRVGTEEETVGDKASSWFLNLHYSPLISLKGVRLQGHVSFRRPLWGHSSGLHPYGGHMVKIILSDCREQSQDLSVHATGVQSS